jgi:hypothetical protein
MATLSTSSLNWLANEWEDVYKSAVLSGIVGDLAHKKRGGYHISRQDQPSNNYSVIRADDKPGNGPSNRAAAIDMTMSTADMKKCHVRLRECWKNRAKDPRMKYINAWNGWDGEGSAGRYDVVKGTVGTATSDHKWHIHLEIRRKYVNDMNAMKAILSMLKGEPYQAVAKPPTPPVEKGDDTQNQGEEMDWTDTFVPSSSWTNRYGTSAPTYKNAILFAAYDSADAERGVAALTATLVEVQQALAALEARQVIIQEILESVTQEPGDVPPPPAG